MSNHSESKWTHPICSYCYAEREPGRMPVMLKESEEEECCFCGMRTTEGIYYRCDPKVVHP